MSPTGYPDPPSQARDAGDNMAALLNAITSDTANGLTFADAHHAVAQWEATKNGAAPTAVPARDVLGNHETRAYVAKQLGKRSVDRATLLRWRKRRGFPKPFRVLQAGELWDRRAVRAWVTEHRKDLYGTHSV